MLATTHEISQIVIDDSPETTVACSEEAVVNADESVDLDLDVRGGAEARAVVEDDLARVEALKKGLMRKKDTKDAKKQKSKVPRK
jgi:hypothetical protein